MNLFEDKTKNNAFEKLPRNATIRFECVCSNNESFDKIMAHIHNSGKEDLVISKLWYSPDSSDIILFVQHQVSYKNPDDICTDWLTAYEVNNISDEDTSCEVFSETIEDNIKFGAVMETMIDFAECTYNKFCKESVN